MATTRADLTGYLDELLRTRDFRDYGPNGLQVEGTEEITSLATAATACLHSCEAAVAAQADVLLVHHGLFWGGPPTVTGMLRRRLGCLLAADCNLLAYHLPLDAHPELGNNAVALRELGTTVAGSFADHRGTDIGLWGEIDQDIGGLERACVEIFAHPVLHCPGGPDRIRRLGIVTGGGQSFLQEAAAIGLDCLITGEASEQSWHEAAECGIHMLACGHHATENRAVHELGAHLAATFELKHHPLPEHNPI